MGEKICRKSFQRFGMLSETIQSLELGSLQQGEVRFNIKSTKKNKNYSAEELHRYKTFKLQITIHKLCRKKNQYKQLDFSRRIKHLPETQTRSVKSQFAVITIFFQKKTVL